MAKNFGSHNDQDWIKGFLRYAVIEKILSSSSFEELNTKLAKSYSLNAANFLGDILWKEFQFNNAIRGIEYELCSFLSKLFEKDSVKDPEKAKLFVAEITKRTNKFKDLQIAINLLDSETGNLDQRIYSPHVLLLIAGFSLGNFIAFLREVKLTSKINTHLLDLLTELNYSRNLTIHNLCSSRVDSLANINKGLALAKEIRDLLV